MPQPEKLLLIHKCGLGDSIVLTALPRDIHAAYPGRFSIATETNFQGVWQHNPHVCELNKAERRGARPITLSYRAGMLASQAGAGIHFLTWFHEEFRKATQLPVPVTEPKGDLHLSEAEQRPFIRGRYWVLVAGGKRDMPTKIWEYGRYQELVDSLHDEGIRIVQCGALHSTTDHRHARLTGVLDLVGQTENLRDFMTVISQAEGVICSITAAMHIAACFDKPTVVLAGGREEWQWEAYVNLDGVRNFGDASGRVRMPHRFLHTVGLLSCCQSRGCWKRLVVPLEAWQTQPKQKRQLCEKPCRLTTGQSVAACMDMITVEHCKDALMSYYRDGSIPPILHPASAAIPAPANSSVVYIPSSEPSAASDASEGQINALPRPTVPVEEPILVRAPSVVRQRTPKSLVPYQEFKAAMPGMTRQPPVTGGDRRQPVAPPVPVASSGDRWGILDHPIIGGGFTIFVLTWGPHHALARRCLESIYRTVPADKCPVRVAANAVCPETLAYLKGLPLDRLYLSGTNLGKYQFMRRMFWDPAQPIKTKWVIWFDDDSHCVGHNWLTTLSQGIIANFARGYRLFGKRFYHNLALYSKNGHRPEQWFQAASWWKGRSLLTRQGRPAPNGSCISFATGGFWALDVDTLRAADIPDIRLNHNGGDCCLGAQVWEAGFDTFNLFSDKRVIAYSDAHRRGYHEQFPWASPGSALPN